MDGRKTTGPGICREWVEALGPSYSRRPSWAATPLPFSCSGQLLFREEWRPAREVGWGLGGEGFIGMLARRAVSGLMGTIWRLFVCGQRLRVIRRRCLVRVRCTRAELLEVGMR